MTLSDIDLPPTILSSVRNKWEQKNSGYDCTEMCCKWQTNPTKQSGPFFPKPGETSVLKPRATSKPPKPNTPTSAGNTHRDRLQRSHCSR